VGGKTVALKIRYDDFETLGVQETGPTEVSSVDDLYERSLALFNKKYQASRGVRLLGVGVMNVKEGSGAIQGELFDQESAKKRAVEQSILALNKKFPKNPVKKARMFS